MLRFAVIALSVTLGFSHSAFAEFNGELLSYGELMSLSTEKRMSYLSEVRDLMVQLEEDQQQYEVSANGSSDLNEKIATLWQLFNPLPDAHAVLEAGTGQDVNAAPSTDTATAAPTGTAAGKPAAAPASPDPAKTDAENSPTSAKPAKIPLPPRRPKKIEAAAAAGDRCPEPGFNCSKMSAKDKQEEIQKFRGDHSPGSNICVSGGFFSTYAGNDKKAHTCHVYHEFPPGSKTPIYTCPKVKGQGPQAICNPILYCVAIKGKAGATGKPKLNPVMNCVEYGGKVGTNITQACQTWYHDSEGKPFDKDHPTVLKEYCDPAQIPADLMKGTKEAWEEIRKATAQKYDKFCMHDKGFAALFCSNCKIMAKHIHAANKAATGSGCAATTASADRPEAPPTDKSGATQ